MKTLNIKNILVPVDFSAISVRAIATAKLLGQRFESTIHLINIQEPIYSAIFFGPGAPVPTSSFETAEELRKSAARQINSLAKENGLKGICDAVIGAPVFNEICAIAQQIPVDLIVTSTHGRTGLKHVFLGSTAERLVQHSPCPVLVARETKTKSKSRKPGVDRILVPVDFSDCSLAGLNYAIQVAEKFAAEIVVLNAVHFSEAYTADGYAMYDLSRVQDAVCKGAEQQMRGMVRRAKFGDVKFKTKVEVGFPLDVILTVAQENNVDLIITATHGRTGFKHVLIGSTAEQVVRYAPCPVLVVPSHPQERAKHLTSRAKRGRELQRSKPVRSAMKPNLREAQRATKTFKITPHPFPERRKTNKFRESHSSAAK